MISALGALWHGLNDVRVKGYTYIWSNILFVVCCLPIVTLPAALSALYRVSYEAQTSPSNADLDLFWQTFKANFWRGLGWGLAHIAFVVVNFTNLSAYADSPGTVAGVLRLVWISAAFIWLGVFLFTWPFYYQMEQPSLWGATRNALVMVLQNPFFTLMILVVVVLIGWLSTVLVAMWFVLTFGIFTAIGTSAVLGQISEYTATATQNI